MCEYFEVERNREDDMYDALAREHMHMEQDLIRRRLEAAARLPRRWDVDEPCTTTAAHRRWWPRARRNAQAGC